MNWYFDQPRNLLVYEHLNSILTQYIPEAIVADNRYTIIPRNLRNSQILRYLNYPVPPIITDENYDWPIAPGRSPLVTQRLQCNFMALHPRSFNLSDPGAMKTLSSLWAADFIMRQYPRGTHRALIIATLSTLETTWAKEIFTNFLSSRTFSLAVD